MYIEKRDFVHFLKKTNLPSFLFFWFILIFCTVWIYKQSFPVVFWINLLRNIDFLFSSITSGTNNYTSFFCVCVCVSSFPIQDVVSQLITLFLMWQINWHKNGPLIIVPISYKISFLSYYYYYHYYYYYCYYYY